MTNATGAGTEDDTFHALQHPLTEDERVFGRKKWIWCSQHARPHMTGWCTVGNNNKRSLLAQNEEDAYNECRALNLKIYKG